MKLSLYIAKRYLFSKKSHNAVNIISMVAVCGVCVATAAMICAMSVFDGFHEFVSGMFSNLDPELKITAVKGKTFSSQEENILQIESFPEIEVFSEVLEDNVLLKYRGRQALGRLKGVSDNFSQSTAIDSILFDGEFKLHDEVNNFGTIGIGLGMQIGIGAGFAFPLEIEAPKRNVKINLSNPSASFSPGYVYVTGVFRTDQEIYDNQLLIVPIALTRELFDYETEVSAIEIKLKSGENIDKIRDKIQKALGENFKVDNRSQQHDYTFRMINMEKWMTFLILTFICLIAVFNVVSSLSMLIVEKKEDIVILKNLGADSKLIYRIFLFEGWMISIIGAISGVALGLSLCFLQQQFGWIKLNPGDLSALTAYPIVVSFSDVLIVLVTVLILGLLAALYPARYLSNKWLKN